MLVCENTNSWIPVVDGRRGGATQLRAERDSDVDGQELDRCSKNTKTSAAVLSVWKVKTTTAATKL